MGSSIVATRAATFTVHPSPPSVVTLRAPVSAPIGLHVHLVAYGGSLRFALWFERAGGPAPFQAPRLRDTGATRHPAQLTHRERPACLPRDAFDRACARHEFGYRNYGAGGLALDTTEGRRTRVDDRLRDDLQGICHGQHQGRQHAGGRGHAVHDACRRTPACGMAQRHGPLARAEWPGRRR